MSTDGLSETHFPFYHYILMFFSQAAVDFGFRQRASNLKIVYLLPIYNALAIYFETWQGDMYGDIFPYHQNFFYIRLQWTLA